MMLEQRALELLRLATNAPGAQFRDGQWEAIEAIVGRNARQLVVERTGWGKSLVYFIATRLLRDQGAGPTLLISPLLSLMRNQIAAAERMGLHAMSVNSTNRNEWHEVSAHLHRGEVDVLIISPEKLANAEFWEEELLPVADQVGLFVVDEAHCISDWGHDFRPDYRRITRILQALPRNVPSLATTATANDRVVRDIESQLGPNLEVVRGPLARTSLRLQNISLPTPAARMAWLAENVPAMRGSGIIYTLTKRDAESVAEWLRHKKIDARAYHGENSDDREEIEQALLQNEVKVVVATSALGMGFDKPDLGFVIHFQRPGSVVLYYQQVGRAGRAIEEAYGVLLGGVEDDQINNFFIRAAFPPEEHSRAVLDALNASEEGLRIKDLERTINLRKSQITRVLKILATESPAPVAEIDGRWRATPVRWEPDHQRIEHLAQIRRAEQERMREYQASDSCLMAFLAGDLNDPHVQRCGQCSPCLRRPLMPPQPSEVLIREAELFLRSKGILIKPRKQWIGDSMAALGWEFKIEPQHQAETGRALSRWKDSGWGVLVAAGKQQGRFADELVARAVEEIADEWAPNPTPTWVTCVPSARHPTLVPDFAARLAQALGLPFVQNVRKIRETEEQKKMQNSHTQLRNLAGAFEIDAYEGISGPVLLVDDTVDSGWTFTVISALLRKAGSGPVFPFALASTASGADS